MDNWILGFRNVTIQWRATHFFAIPLLSAPAQALRINDAGASAATTLVFCHVLYSRVEEYLFWLDWDGWAGCEAIAQ
jgi:hypothetical protein